MFAISEVVLNLEQKEAREVFTKNVGGLMPSWSDLKASFLPTLRGTAIGAFFGILPGTGPSISSFSAYMLEKKLAKAPSRFGQGAVEGVAAPEAANNAAAQTAFIPVSYTHLDVYKRQLWALPNLIATPHIAGVTAGSAKTMAEIAARHVIAVLDGEEPDAASLARLTELAA